MTYVTLLARNEEINKWLNEHPLVLGLLFLVIGLAVGGWGLYELYTGVSYDKRGNAMTGGMGKTLSVVRVVMGVGCIGFAAYRMIFG